MSVCPNCEQIIDEVYLDDVLESYDDDTGSMHCIYCHTQLQVKRQTVYTLTKPTETEP